MIPCVCNVVLGSEHPHPTVCSICLCVMAIQVAALSDERDELSGRVRFYERRLHALRQEANRHVLDSIQHPCNRLTQLLICPHLFLRGRLLLCCLRCYLVSFVVWLACL